MSSEDYRPRLIDTSHVGLLREIEARKLDPNLIPYEELPESEKNYDRATTMETAKAILALGFRISRE